MHPFTTVIVDDDDDDDDDDGFPSDLSGDHHNNESMSSSLSLIQTTGDRTRRCVAETDSSDSSDSSDPVVAPRRRLNRDETHSTYRTNNSTKIGRCGRGLSRNIASCHKSAPTAGELVLTSHGIEHVLDVMSVSSSEGEDIGDSNHTIERFRSSLSTKEYRADRQLLYPPSLRVERRPSPESDDTYTLRDGFMAMPLQDEWREMDLRDFCVYNGLDHKRYPGQFESLHTVASEQNTRTYLLDGTVTCQGHDIILEGARICSVSVGGLDRGCHSCGDELWVQTKESRKYQGWFKLVHPTQFYQPIWHNFRWVANLAKYCMDYLVIAKHESSHEVCLHDFQSSFMECMQKEHGHDASFQEWHQMHRRAMDVRRHIVQFGNFIFDQCHSAGLDDDFKTHPLWNEIGCGFVPHSVVGEQQTLVTRNAARTFLTSFPLWGPHEYDLLVQSDCHDRVDVRRAGRMQALRIPDKFRPAQEDNFRREQGRMISKVEWTLHEARRRNRSIGGDPSQLLDKLVVVRQRRPHGTEDFDFALVTQITNDKKRVRIVWLTLPLDTICASPWPGRGRASDDRGRLKAHYPIGNELFFSNDCNCYSVHISDIVAIHDICIMDEFRGQHCEFFATTLYCGSDHCFVVPDQSRWPMMCRELCANPFTSGSHISYDTASCRRSNQRPYRDGILPDKNPENNPWHRETFSNLSLFTGCGLLDRALESSAPLHTTLSIDCNAFAIRSAKANTCSSARTTPEFIHGSVNHELEKVMTGRRTYPEPTCLSAGCPCPGFSLLNQNKRSRGSQLNCTLLASTMSWIEVTLPVFVVIENVPQMDTGSPSACSQAISFLVALGYQVRKVTLNASDHGGCTTRQRLFILASTPGYRLPLKPEPTHGIGRGLQPKVTVSDQISDLPYVHNDTLLNIVYPYHVPLARLQANLTNDGPNFRDMLHQIPKSPPGQGLIASKKYLTGAQREWITTTLSHQKQQPRSLSMTRIKASGFFRTIVTSPHWLCAISGQLIHYDQDRVISLEEAARAQGVPRDFILIGHASQKLKQVGNAVPWCLREAIGREIARALGDRPRLDPTAEEDLFGHGELSVAPPSHTASRVQRARDDNDDNEVQFGTKADFDRAQVRRQNRLGFPNCYGSAHQRTLRIQTANHSRPDASSPPNTTHCAFEQRTTPPHTVPYSTIGRQRESRSSVPISKRSRLPSSSEDTEVRAGRAVKRQAKVASDLFFHEPGKRY